MSLPNSEPLPESIHDLPPARQRHIRRQPRSASRAERQLLLSSLLSLTAPNPNYFLLSLLGAIALGAALYFDDPSLLVLALILLPFLRPVFGLALLPASRKAMPGLKSLISLLVLLVLNFAAGVLAGYLQKDLAFTHLALYRFSVPYWLDLALVGLSAILAVFVMLRKGALPRLIGVLLAYEILLPLAVAGFSFPLGASQLFPSALLVSIMHLGLAAFLATLAFFALGFAPQNLGSWALTLLPVMLALGGLLLSLPNLPRLTRDKIQPTETPTPITAPSNTPLAHPTATGTATHQPPTRTTAPTRTYTPSPTTTPSPTQTQTPEPTTFIVIVDALSGAVIRESPNFNALVTGYLNDEDSVEIQGAITEEGTLWYQITAPQGQTGWLLGSLVNTRTPTEQE